MQLSTRHCSGTPGTASLSAANAHATINSASIDPSNVHINVVALILMALLVSFLALMVYLELIVRAALILTVTAFIPLIAVLAIWPRLAEGAVHMAEFVMRAAARQVRGGDRLLRRHVDAIARRARSGAAERQGGLDG